MTALPVSEVFGPTWQGEGPYAGVRTGFVRLGLCNLSCEWCDTPYTWDRTRYDLSTEAPTTDLAVVHRQLETMNVDTVCLSGGEPLIHHHHLPELLVPAWSWHAETNGTIAPPAWWTDRVDHTSVSPKINTRDPHHKRIKLPALGAWNELADEGLACFKFVADTTDDLDTIDAMAELVGMDPRVVWIMPLGTTAPELLERHAKLAQGIEDRGWNTTTRLHILLYGSERKR